MKKYHQYNDIPSELLTSLGERVVQSPYRQQFHVEGDMGYINDPNGVCYFDGKYHLFYQWSPLAYSENSWFQGWYHLISDDMICWEDAGVGIQTDTVYETHGAYSGSAIADGDTMRLFYTGNTRDENNERIPYQVIALMDKEGHLSKVTPPAITGYPEGYTDHFRDPKLWRGADGDYYAVIGAQRQNKTGTSLLLHSVDGFSWNSLGEVGTGYQEFGYMWECPNYFEIDEKGILLFSPQGLAPQGNHYHNIYQTGYILGDKIDKTNLQLTTEQNFVELDRGFDFYAAQVIQAQGRTILFAWMGLPEIHYPTEEYAYCGCLTMPRELFLEGDKMYQRPLPELEQYRSLVFEDVFQLLDLNGKWFETGFQSNLQIAVSNIQQKGQVIIDLLASEDRKNTCQLVLDYAKQKIILDRSRAGAPVAEEFGNQRVIFEELGKETLLDIYLDRSSLEIFINDGQEVASSRIFPDETQLFTHISSKEAEVELSIKHYQLDI